MCTEVIDGWGRTPEHEEINRCNTHMLTLYKPRAGFDNQCLKHDVHVTVTDRRTHDYTVHYSALAEDLSVRVSQLNSITPCPYRMDELRRYVGLSSQAKCGYTWLTVRSEHIAVVHV